ncbi:MAG: hypothetical protein LAO30_06090 [Acidobacteriia bacterium]|nr:hypothetical protein [Terriglobia bacterium]
MQRTKQIWVITAALLLVSSVSSSAQSAVPAPIHGVTVDDKHDIRDPKVLAKVIDSLSHLSVKPTTRIVYKPGNKKEHFAAGSYVNATRQIRAVGYVMGQPVDSFYMHCFTPTEYLARFKDYVDTFGPIVDIWEVGNEINGEWLFGNTRRCRPKASVSSTSQADAVTKMTEAYDYVKSQGKVAALTLYYNTPCERPAANEMFTWVNANVPERMKTGLDYVLVSYYEVDCRGYRADWQSLFSRIAAIFPNSKLGISEFGWSNSRASNNVVKDLISRYYALHPDVSNWVGGGFYWEFAIDMVPYDPRPDSMWSTIDTAMAKQK